MDQLDQIIGFLNRPSKPQLPPLQHSTLHTVFSDNQKNISKKFKYLTFKPWSGIIRNEDQREITPIKEEIQAESEANDKDDREEFVGLSNAAQDNQIGYFYKFQTGHVKLIKYLLDENGFKYASSNKNWSLYWSSTIIKPQIYSNLLPYQKVNHFPSSFNLTRKDLMNKMISKMQSKYGITHFNFLPKTYILPKQYDLLKDEMEKSGYTYIVKPHNSSQGKGITVTQELAVVQAKLERYSSLVVSHYVNNPLLINRLKFDLRIYVAITGVNPLRIYVYEQGLARFATQVYDHSNQDSQNKKFQHLTNYSINKKNSQFQKPSLDEQYFGSKWSLTSLKSFLSYNIGPTQTQQLFERIYDLITKTIICGESILFNAFNKNVGYINSCFQVLGFDILIDSGLKPWLIEVNMSPSMNTDSQLDLRIKGEMISDLFTMAGVVPLAERYNDNTTKMENKHFVKNDMLKLEPNSLVDKFIVKMVEQEYERRGKWNRVFPVRNNKYKNYFQVDRYFNRLLREGLIEPLYKAPIIISTKQQKSRASSIKRINFRTKNYSTKNYSTNKSVTSGSSNFKTLKRL